MTSKFAFSPLHTVRIMPRHFLCFSHGLKQTFQMALEMKLTAKHFVKNENSVGCFKLFLLPFFSFLKASIFVLNRSFSFFILGIVLVPSCSCFIRHAPCIHIYLRLDKHINSHFLMTTELKLSLIKTNTS